MTVLLGVFDPPWLSDSGGGGKGANAQYALMHGRLLARQILAANLWTGDDALGWCWTTTLSIVSGEAHEFIATLGMRPCATWPWIKTEEPPDDDGWVRLRRKPGIGQWQFCDHEILVTCRRGSLKLPDVRQRSPIFAPVGEHSEKPEEAWRRIESVSADVLRGVDDVVATEFFSRTPRRGWGAYGTLDGPDTPVRHEPARGEWR
jgi:N6-adenosine-specific RNA methylase IME4